MSVGQEFGTTRLLKQFLQVGGGGGGGGVGALQGEKQTAKRARISKRAVWGMMLCCREISTWLDGNNIRFLCKRLICAISGQQQQLSCVGRLRLLILGQSNRQRSSSTPPQRAPRRKSRRSVLTVLEPLKPMAMAKPRTQNSTKMAPAFLD